VSNKAVGEYAASVARVSCIGIPIPGIVVSVRAEITAQNRVEDQLVISEIKTWLPHRARFRTHRLCPTKILSQGQRPQVSASLRPCCSAADVRFAASSEFYVPAALPVRF
jgi:hypothetical protein